MKLLLLIALAAVTASPEESQVLTDFVAGNVEYIGKVYNEVARANPDNFLVSPLSVQLIFALINGGARGNTARQITKGLHLPEGEDRIRETFLRLTKTLQTNDQYTLSCANKIYLENRFKIHDHFKNTSVAVFDAEIATVDFGETQQAVAEINAWVEEKTHSKIKNLLTPDTLSRDTVAVLINALYFQGTWVKEFEEFAALPFRINRSLTVLTNMMTISDDFNYYDSPELKAKFVEFPYAGDEITMTFVLPNTFDGLPALEARISEVLVAPKYIKEHVDVIIPKFKVESTIAFIPILQALGITDAFTNAADFTGIGQNQDELSISQVIQKTFIEVDEKGTTAAAATFVSFDRISGGDGGFKFVADHPFIFYLKHRVNGIFFIGRYSNPEEVES